MKARVAVIYKSLPQYRRTFFELLRMRLADFDIEFILIYGQPGKTDSTKKDTVELDWATKIKNSFFYVKNRELFWQPVLNHLQGVDLVIVEQASKLLVNYILLLRGLLHIQKMAFWGHGKNFQAKDSSILGEAIKKLVSTKVHWWFTYNKVSTEVVTSMGFPKHRITNVQNAIDTKSLTHELSNINSKHIIQLRSKLGICGDHIGLYVGGIYAEKRISFLLDACRLIREKIPDFEMIFIGSGTDKFLVEQAAEIFTWIHYVGPKLDAEKVPFFALSDIFLMPGLVGLSILDSFALETPMVTTDYPYHSPEIEYLENGINGLIVPEYTNVNTYAQAVISLLKNKDKISQLKEGCRLARDKYTVEEMVERFARGVVKALEDI